MHRLQEWGAGELGWLKMVRIVPSVIGQILSAARKPAFHSSAQTERVMGLLDSMWRVLGIRNAGLFPVSATCHKCHGFIASILASYYPFCTHS